MPPMDRSSSVAGDMEVQRDGNSGRRGSVGGCDHNVVDFQNSGPSEHFALAGFISLCSGLLAKPLQEQMVIFGNMSLGGSVEPARSLAEALQITFDSGGKRILLPMSSVGDIPSVPGELFSKFQVSFYADPVDAVFKGLGVG